MFQECHVSSFSRQTTIVIYHQMNKKDMSCKHSCKCCSIWQNNHHGCLFWLFLFLSMYFISLVTKHTQPFFGNIQNAITCRSFYVIDCRLSIAFSFSLVSSRLVSSGLEYQLKIKENSERETRHLFPVNHLQQTLLNYYRDCRGTQSHQH